MDPRTLVLIVEDEDDDVGLIQRRLRITGILNPGWVWRGGEEGTTFLEGAGEYDDGDTRCPQSS